jgi:hypothetical protein
MIDLERSEQALRPDPRRLVARPFLPGSAAFGGDSRRLELIVDRILDLPPEIQGQLLAETLHRSAGRHRDIRSTWLGHFEMACEPVPRFKKVSDPDVRLLIGAYLTLGYAYEGAALTNPSIVPFGQASGGSQPFVLSARAIGEGHISSVAFFTGMAGQAGSLSFDDRSPFADNGERKEPLYQRLSFTLKLAELGFANEVSERILSALPEEFTPADLYAALPTAEDIDLDPILLSDTVRMVHWLSASSYEVTFDPDLPISEHLISPAAPAESHGMEDARFVRFVEDDGEVTYYATYTAYDGMRILPQVIKTKDFHHFRMSTMSGPTAYHKGLALFPRRIRGEFAAVSRHDQETTFVMRSDNIRHWGNAEAVLVPEQGWEAIQTLDHPRCRRDEALCPRCGAARSRRANQSAWPTHLATPRAERGRVDGLRARCRLFMREHDPRRAFDPPVWLRRLRDQGGVGPGRPGVDGDVLAARPAYNSA